MASRFHRDHNLAIGECDERWRRPKGTGKPEQDPRRLSPGLESCHDHFLDVKEADRPVQVDLGHLFRVNSCFRELRKADKTGNVMTLIYSPLENPYQEVIAVEKETNKLRLYHREDDVSRLDVDKVSGLFFRHFDD